MASAFDDEKSYELTELGKQFVHYTMNEIVPRIWAAPRRHRLTDRRAEIQREIVVSFGNLKKSIEAR